MNQLYGYAGKLLRVDLTNERITEEEVSEETARKYIGGAGLGAKYLHEGGSSDDAKDCYPSGIWGCLSRKD